MAEGTCEYWRFVTTHHALDGKQKELTPPRTSKSTSLVSATVIEAPHPQVVCIWMVAR